MKAKHSKKHYSKKNIKNKREKNRANLTLFQKILLIIFIIVFCYSTFTLINWYIRTIKTDNKYKELAKQVIIQNEEQEADENKSKEKVINFEELKKIKEDIIG